MGSALRSSDERLLRWIAERCRGVPARIIAERERLGTARITNATNAVRDADAAESGEDVRGSYW